MFSVKSSGSGVKMEDTLERMARIDPLVILNQYGRVGVDSLGNATPVDSGRASESWYYDIKSVKGGHILTFYNSDIEGGAPVAILIQYGHGTGTGGYVQGRDYINPAIRPIFDQIASDIWNEVRNA